MAVRIALALLVPLAGAFSLSRPAALDVLLQVRLANGAPAKLEEWLMKRSFAAVLPMQPMLVLPLEKPQYGVSLTFRRKPTSEWSMNPEKKGGQDGGVRFTIGDDDGCTVLLVSRISEGQFTTKMFSEKALCKALTKDLEKLPAECGTVTGIVELPVAGKVLPPQNERFENDSVTG
jgi:hypothetical protein